MSSWNNSNRSQKYKSYYQQKSRQPKHNIDISADYQSKEHIETEETHLDPILTSKLKFDAPMFQPKNSSNIKEMMLSNQDLKILIQQDKFFNNNKFNLNSSNQNLMIESLKSKSTHNFTSLPQNPVINPILNGHNLLDSHNFLNTDYNYPQNEKYSLNPISPNKKLDIHANIFIKKDTIISNSSYSKPRIDSIHDISNNEKSNADSSLSKKSPKNKVYLDEFIEEYVKDKIDITPLTNSSLNEHDSKIEFVINLDENRNYRNETINEKYDEESLNEEVNELSAEICKDDEIKGPENTGFCLEALKNVTRDNNRFNYTEHTPDQTEEVNTNEDKYMNEVKSTEIIEKFVISPEKRPNDDINKIYHENQEKPIEFDNASLNLIQSDIINPQIEDKLQVYEFVQDYKNIAQPINSSTQTIFGNESARKFLEITTEDYNKESYPKYIQSNEVTHVDLNPKTIFYKKNDPSYANDINISNNIHKDICTIKKLQQNNLLEQEHINDEANKVIQTNIIPEKNIINNEKDKFKEKKKNFDDFINNNDTNNLKFEIKNKINTTEEEFSKEFINDIKQKSISHDLDLFNKIKQFDDYETHFQNNSEDIISNQKIIIYKMEDDLSKFSTGSSLNLAENNSNTFEKYNFEETTKLNEDDLKNQDIRIIEQTPKSSKLGEILKNKQKFSETNAENLKQENTTKYNKKPKNIRKGMTTINTQNTVKIKESTIQQVIEIKEEAPIFQIKNFYFKVRDNEAKTINKYSEAYLMYFRDWKISKESRLIDEVFSSQSQQMKIFTDERRQINNNNNINKMKYEKDKFNKHSENDDIKSYSQSSKSVFHIENTLTNDDSFSRLTNHLTTNPQNTSTIGNWARRNNAEADKEAEIFKGKMENEMKIDPIKDELKEILNKSTLDNYESIKSLVFGKISSSIENQEKFLEVLFKKAIVEKSYVVIYARLCKDLDDELPQKLEIHSNDKKNLNSNSVFRSKLIEKCKKIFKEDLSNFDIKINDPSEREQIEKDFTLGNVNFIGELIKSKILSKNVVFQCIDFLMTKDFKFINIEAIVNLLDKFGTEINSFDNINKLKTQELNSLNVKIDTYFESLSKIADKYALPGFIKYKIINLKEKKNRGWVESKVDQVLKIKSLKEVRDEFEQEMKDNSSNIQPKRLEIDQVNKQILNDLELWKNWKIAKKNENKFNWQIIENLIKNEKQTVGSILTSFGDIIIDYIKDNEDVDYCFSYINNIISFYKMNKKDKNEVVEVVLLNLSNLNDNLLDNKHLIDIWVKILYLVINCEIFFWKDFERLNELSEEQNAIIFRITSKTIKKFKLKEQNQIYKEITKFNCFKSFHSQFFN